MRSYILSNDFCSQANKILEVRIEKVKDTFTSGVSTMKELADALQMKASSDLEQLKSTIYAHMMAVENVKHELNDSFFFSGEL